MSNIQFSANQEIKQLPEDYACFWDKCFLDPFRNKEHIFPCQAGSDECLIEKRKTSFNC